MEFDGVAAYDDFGSRHTCQSADNFGHAVSGISIGGSRSSTSISLTPVRACGNAIETMPPNLPLAFGDQDRGSSLLIPPFAASS